MMTVHLVEVVILKIFTDSIYDLPFFRNYHLIYIQFCISILLAAECAFLNTKDLEEMMHEVQHIFILIISLLVYCWHSFPVCQSR